MKDDREIGEQQDLTTTVEEPSSRCAANTFLTVGETNVPVLPALLNKKNRIIPISHDVEADKILEGINRTREARLVFDSFVADPNVLNLLSCHCRSLSPVESIADALNLSGEVRKPFTRFFPIPALVDLHGSQPISEEDISIAAATASVDARMLWDHIEARIRDWARNYAAFRARTTQTELGPREEIKPEERPEILSEEVQAALAKIDSMAALEKAGKTFAHLAGGETLPLLKSLPLLPLAFLTQVGLEHRKVVLAVSGLEPAGLSGTIRKLASGGVLQLGLSIYCCSRHKDHPFAFMALGQRSPPQVTCPTCEASVPGLSYYHFEPFMSMLLGRPGGVLEPLVWKLLEKGRVSYAPLVRLPGHDERELDAVFVSKKGGYGVVECKTWLRRSDDTGTREQIRQALAQLADNVAMLASNEIQVDFAALVTNRRNKDQQKVAASILGERKLVGLTGVEVLTLSATEVPRLLEVAKVDTKS